MKKELLLILGSPLLLTLGWPPLPLSVLLFLGFVPLLILEEVCTRWFRLKAYVTLLLWNIGCTWWVWNASPGGAVSMLLANTLLMWTTVLIYRKVKSQMGTNTGLAAWIISWLSMEYLHLNWEIAFPWLNLGNGFAGNTTLVQWYEYSGALGGSLWILTVNALLFRFYQNRQRKTGFIAMSVLIVPVLISLAIFNLRKPFKEQKTTVTVVQPNIDPYTKFDQQDHQAEANYLIRLAEPKLDRGSEFLLFPETAVTENCEEPYINQSTSYSYLGYWLQKYPTLTLITGGNTFRFMDSLHRSPTARPLDRDRYYDIYNSAVCLTAEGVRDIYRKSKLVPGVEKMPYTGLFGFLEHLAIDMGGISGSLGEDTVSRVFRSNRGTRASALICYESVFGEHVAGFVKNGAELLFVLTNDGWWGNTPGYRQHKMYASLRAIENRRYLVRCTNTGVSCMIDPLGRISGETPWWEPACESYRVTPSDSLTFYTRYGDLLGKMAAGLFPVVILMSFAGRIVRKRIFS